MGRRFSRHFSPLALTNARAACSDRAEWEGKDVGEYRVRPMHQHASATFPRLVAHPPATAPERSPKWPTPTYRRKLERKAARRETISEMLGWGGVANGTA